jgi:acetyl esterase/lipase
MTPLYIQKSIILFLLASHSMFPQTQNNELIIPRDTSFTVFSSYQKEIKKFPFIKVAQSNFSDEIIADSNLVFTSYGKRNLHLDICYPRHKTKLFPAIILVHGGGWRSGDKSQQVPMAQEIASHGFIAATVEYRLSPEAKFPAAIFDLKAAVRWIRANSSIYSVDSNKISILGCSSGGHLASMLGATNCIEKFEGNGDNLNHSSNVQAVINIDGILDFTDPAESGKDQDLEKPSVGKLWLGYSYKDNPEIWRIASPINYIDSKTPPFLFLNSSIDRFHAGRDFFIEKLNRFRIYSEIHTFPDAPHTFWFFHPWFKSTTKIVIEFLDKIFN